MQAELAVHQGCPDVQGLVAGVAPALVAVSQTNPTVALGSRGCPAKMAHPEDPALTANIA